MLEYITSHDLITIVIFIISIILISVFYLKIDCDETREEIDESCSYYELNENCQSPINLNPLSANFIPTESKPSLTFSKEYHLLPDTMFIFNNSHHIVLCASWNDNKRPTLNGGPLTGKYKFINIKFRWGVNDNEGSEHMINLKQYAMEIQVVFRKCDDSSNDQEERMAVISYLFEVTPNDNPFLEPIVNSLNSIKTANLQSSIKPTFLSLIVPAFTTHYFTYSGSLTWPPYTQPVQWIIQSETLAISSRQVGKFRAIQTTNGALIASNVRPLQKRGDRNVSYFS